MTHDTKTTDEFRAEAQRGRTGLIREFWDFLKHNKKWWLLPILVVMALVAVLVLLQMTGAGPFIYTMF